MAKAKNPKVVKAFKSERTFPQFMRAVINNEKPPDGELIRCARIAMQYDGRSAWYVLTATLKRPAVCCVNEHKLYYVNTRSILASSVSKYIPAGADIVQSYAAWQTSDNRHRFPVILWRSLEAQYGKLGQITRDDLLITWNIICHKFGFADVIGDPDTDLSTIPVYPEAPVA